MELTPSLLAGALLVGLTGVASANSASTTIPVTATVQPACSVWAADLSFPNVGNISTEAGFTGAQAQGTVLLTCNDDSLSATVELDAPPMVSVFDGTTELAYNLYQDASLSTPWGTVANSTAQIVTNTYGRHPLMIYGQIPAQPNVHQGVYQAQVNVTVTY